MNEKNIVFLEPKGSKANVFSNNMQHPLLGQLYMATALHELGYDVTVIKENLVSEEIVERHLKRADVLSITMLINSANRGYEIARRYKRLRPDGKVIAGGIHVSFNPGEAAGSFDHVVVGEGQLIIKDLVDGKVEDRIVDGERLENLDDLPIPDFSLLVNFKKLKMIPIITSLGCPNNCIFCCVTRMFGTRYRCQSARRILSELKHHFNRLGNKYVFFYDDNFGANKKRCYELFDEMERNNLKFLWICQVRADLAADEHFVKRMAEAGCRRVFIGYESLNEQNLKEMKKNESFETIEHSIEVFHRYGIAIHGMFIYGADHDTAESFRNTVDFCTSHHIESAQFIILTPIPGTELWKKTEHAILSTNWDI